MTDTLKSSVIGFVQRHHIAGGTVGEYRYSMSTIKPTLYSSCYASMIYALFGELDRYTSDEKQAWGDYLNSFQDDDGLYRDPVIFGEGWYKDDPFDCGRPHLTCHAIIALTCLGCTATKEFALSRHFADLNLLDTWLSERDFGERVGWTGNEIMNLGMLLQYSRDFHNDSRAGHAAEHILDWLDCHYLNADTGIWGTLDISDPVNRSHAVQAAYHWWPLYFYDGRQIPCIERAIDTLLLTQNPDGGFGWGVHNSENPFTSSACEDIDSIDPLSRMSMQTDYRRDDIAAALNFARNWVLRNQVPDGGFVFMKDISFEYGNPELLGSRGQGAMFPTWFRTLSLAILETALGDAKWSFSDCPGYQYRLNSRNQQVQA